MSFDFNACRNWEKKDTIVDSPKFLYCRDCSAELNIRDYLMLCNNCGLDYGSLPDENPEWKSCGPDDQRTSDPTRCGASINPILIESSYGTTISYSNNPIYKRLKQINTWMSQPYSERSARTVFNLLTQIGTANGITTNIIEDSHRLFYEAICEQERNPDKTSSRGNYRTGLIASCLSQACKEFDVPRSSQEIARIFNISNSDVTRGKNLFNDLMKNSTYVDIKKDMLNYTAFLDRYCDSLGLTTEQQEKITKFTQKVQEKKILSRNTPETLLCGCIYYVSVMHNFGITRQDISQKCDTSIPTINKIYERLLQFTHELV